MLLTSHGHGAGADGKDWAAEDLRAYADFQHALDEELTASGELVGTCALAAPETAKLVTGDGVNPPVVTDGLPHTRHPLAGYRTVEVASQDRALEIAGRMSAAPGPGGGALQQPVEVRAVLASGPGG